MHSDLLNLPLTCSQMTAPVHSIQIDASAHCQLACPSCPIADGSVKLALGQGHLDPTEFEKLLASNPRLEKVELSNYGEMFLNPRPKSILRIARDHNVVIHAWNGVNLNHASDEVLEALVEFGVLGLTCSSDGASAETYRQYRHQGDFDRVLGHIQKLNEYKRKHRSAFPILRWQYIAFGHNEHEISLAKRRAQQLGMDFFVKLNWDEHLSPIKHHELVQIAAGAASRSEFYERNGVDYARHI